MSADQNRAISTLLDAVCLLGILWQLDLLEYGQRLINEGFEDIETLSTMTDRDFQKIRFKVTHAKRLRSFARRASQISDLLPSNKARPLDTWGQTYLKTYGSFWQSPKVGSDDNDSEAFNIPELTSFFKERAKRVKTDRKRTHDDTESLSARPFIRQIMMQARELAVAWLEPSVVRLSLNAPTSPYVHQSHGYAAQASNTSLAPSLTASYISSPLGATPPWTMSYDEKNKRPAIQTGSDYTSGATSNHDYASLPSAHDSLLSADGVMDLTGVDFGSPIGSCADGLDLPMAPYLCHQTLPLVSQQPQVPHIGTTWDIFYTYDKWPSQMSAFVAAHSDGSSDGAETTSAADGSSEQNN